MRYKNFEIQIEPARPMRVNRDGMSAKMAIGRLKETYHSKRQI